MFDFQECKDECEQRGHKYFWCDRKIDGGWGYCSPKTVYNGLVKVWEIYCEEPNCPQYTSHKYTSKNRYYRKTSWG